MGGRNDRFVVGLDIGTTKICCDIAEKKDNGGLDVIGVGRSASRGLRKGVVVNVDQTVDALKSAVEQAELMAGETVERAFVAGFGCRVILFTRPTGLGEWRLSRAFRLQTR